jgi:glutamate carboxypeptidase
MPAPHELLDDLAHTIAGWRADALDRLECLVSVESPSGDPAALAAMGDELTAGFTAVGCRAERDGDHLVLRAEPRAAALHARPALLVLGHLDTVWPIGQLADMPFHVDDEGRVTGPGVFDMKGGLVALELALRAVRLAGAGLAQPLRVVVVGDEEIGSPDGARLVANHSAGAAAVLGLEPALPGGVLKTGRRGVSRVRVAVTGRAAHAGLDQAKGVSAIDELVDQLVELRATLPREAGVAVNVGTVAGGGRANVVPAHAHAEIGLRYRTPEQEQALRDAFAALRPRRADARVAVETLSRRPAWPEPVGNPLLDHLTDLAARLGQPLSGRAAGGAGDTNLTGSLGIPTLDGLGPNGKGAHSVEEMVWLPAILERAALLAAILVTPLPDAVLAIARSV